MPSIKRISLSTGVVAVALAMTAASWVSAQERVPWMSGQSQPYQSQPYQPAPSQGGQGYGQQPPPEEAYPPNQPYGSGGGYRPNDLPPSGGGGRSSDTFRPADPYRQDDPRSGGRPPVADAYRSQGGGRVDDAYRPPAPYNADQGGPPQGGFVDNYRRGRSNAANQPPPSPRDDAGGGYGAPYTPAPQAGEEPYDREYQRGAPLPPRERGPGHASDGTYSKNEITSAGHSFFGSISSGLASVIEHAFQQSGRPNGYILGEDAGGAFVAGLRYGEGVLHTKDAGTHRVYWQGPSLGYDFGAEGSKTMVLVYNLRDPQQIYDRFGGVQGSAYLVGGVSIQFQKNEDVVLAPIRAGVGLRLGANVGYLKYTRTPTWNPF